MTINEALNEFILAGQADGLSPATLIWYRRIVAKMATHFTNRDIASITRHDMRAYIADLRERNAYQSAPQQPEKDALLSKDSITSYITALHRFWNWCAGEYDLANPMQGIKRPQRPKPQPKAIEGEDFVRLFQAATDSVAGIRDRALLAFLGDTGCRLGGLLSLTVDRLHVAQRKAYVYEKGGKSRTVFFTRYTALLLDCWIGVRKAESDHVFISMDSQEGLSMSGVHEILKRLKRRAGVTGRVNPHSFRHRFAREFIRRGGDISTLAKLLGHEDLNVTALYYAVFDEDELRDMHDRFSPLQ